MINHSLGTFHSKSVTLSLQEVGPLRYCTLNPVVTETDPLLQPWKLPQFIPVAVVTVADPDWFMVS